MTLISYHTISCHTQKQTMHSTPWRLWPPAAPLSQKTLPRSLRIKPPRMKNQPTTTPCPHLLPAKPFQQPKRTQPKTNRGCFENYQPSHPPEQRAGYAPHPTPKEWRNGIPTVDVTIGSISSFHPLFSRRNWHPLEKYWENPEREDRSHPPCRAFNSPIIRITIRGKCRSLRC